MLAALLDTNPGVRERRGRPGRPRRRPDKLHARLGIRLSALSPLPAPARHRGSDPRRGVENSSRLRRVRWVVERTMSGLLGFRRLALRYDRTVATLSALLALACALICHRRLP
jgi:transposase